MSKKGIWFVVSIVAVMGMLVATLGCAGGTSTPAASPTATKPATTTPAAAPIVLKVAGYGGPTYPLRIMQEEANKLMEERSGGRLKIDFYPDNSLINHTKVFEVLPSGVADIAITTPTYAPDIMGVVADVANMPFNWDQQLFAQHYRDAGNFFDFQQPYWAKAGLYLLSWGNVGGYEVGSRSPIRTVADWKGKLVRTVKGFDAFIKALGAEPTFIGPNEVYEAMQRGTVDAATISMSSLRTLSIHEVAPYFTVAGLTEANLEFVMSQKTREKLPADLLKIVDDAHRDAEKAHYARLLDLIKADTEFIAKSPKVIEVYYLPAAEKAIWAEKAQVVYDGFAKKWGAEFQKFMELRKAIFK